MLNFSILHGEHHGMTLFKIRFQRGKNIGCLTFLDHLDILHLIVNLKMTLAWQYGQQIEVLHYLQRELARRLHLHMNLGSNLSAGLLRWGTLHPGGRLDLVVIDVLCVVFKSIMGYIVRTVLCANSWVDIILRQEVGIWQKLGTAQGILPANLPFPFTNWTWRFSKKLFYLQILLHLTCSVLQLH